MPRRDYGPTLKKRAKRLLEALLDYADGELELDDSFRKKVKVTPQQDGSKLYVVGSKALLIELINADRHLGRLTESQFDDAMAYLQKYLKILERHTGQGVGELRLTIALWHSDKEKNLKAFEDECKRKNAEKKPKAGQDPWVKVRKFVPSEFDLLDDRFFKARGRGESPILRLPSATWSLITQGNYIDRDCQEDVLAMAEKLAEYDGISLLLIRGQPGAGKTALMRWLAYQLSSQENIVLQKNPHRDELYWLESLWEFSDGNHSRHFYLIADDLFRDETIVEELERNELQFPLTLIGTTRLNEDQQERLRRGGYPIQSLDLELYPSEKERIWQQVCQQDAAAKARLEQMASAERDRLMASPSMLALMLQLSEGKEFDLIVADVIKRLPSEADYPVYQVFGVICSFYQYSLIVPPEILPLCLPDYSSKAVRDVVDIAIETELKGLVNTMCRAGYEGVGTIHQLIAQTALTVKYSRRPGENLPYSPSLLEDYLRTAIQALDPTYETHKRWACHGLRLLAVNGVDNLVRQVLNDYPEAIQALQQVESRIIAWTIWAKMYEAVGLLDERDRCFNAMLSTEPQTTQERFHWLLWTNRLGTSQQKQQALAQTATWLQHHPENRSIRIQYLKLMGQGGTSQQKHQAIAHTATWLQQHSEDQEVRRTYLALISQYGTSQQKQQALAHTATWLQQHSENTDVRTPYLALISKYGTSQQKQQEIAHTATWLQHHPEDYHVRTQYLALIGKYGTSKQKQEALAQTATWLQQHPENTNVRAQYLKLIGQDGESKQKQEAIAQTATWLQQHPEDYYVRTQYLALIGKYGTSKQKQEAIAQTASWLQDYPENTDVRTKYLALIKQYGTPLQKQEAIAQTASWLQDYPEAGYVRTIYWGLVGKAGKDLIDVEPIITQQWQWICQQPTIEQSLWTTFLGLLHDHAQLHSSLGPLIQPAVNLALEQHPKNQNIISRVFGYFGDYLNYETYYRLAQIISDIKKTSFWQYFIDAANFFRDRGELDKAEAIYLPVMKTAESSLNQQRGDIQNLRKTLQFAELNYAYLLLLRQPPDPYMASEYLDRILDDNSKHAVAHCYLAQCYQAKGKKLYPKAIQHFQKGVQFDQQKAGFFWYQFGCFYRDAMENTIEARKCFEASLNQKINFPTCIDLAELEVEAGNWETAKELLQQGLALVPITRPEKEHREKLQPRVEALQKEIDNHIGL